jgi:hypothetical protein
MGSAKKRGVHTFSKWQFKPYYWKAHSAWARKDGIKATEISIKACRVGMLAIVIRNDPFGGNFNSDSLPGDFDLGLACSAKSVTRMSTRSYP